MATYTDNYNLVKPTMAETADIRTINGNMDTIDDILHASQVSLAPAYDANSTYNTGDVVMYELLMYECLDDDVTGVWDATKWQRTTAGEHGGGSDVEITPTLQSGTKIADFEIDGVSGALYAPSGGGGGGGGSSQTIADVLWSGTATPSTTGTDITLSHAISDYDFIVFTVNQSGSAYDSVVVIAVNELTVGESYIETGYGGSQMDVFFDYTSDTTINIKSSVSAYLTTYTKITGLKFCGTLAPMIYSTEEREVGVWVDDKPLYQKTFDLTSQALTDNTWNNGILGTTGISIKSYKGYFNLGTGAIFPYEYYRNNSEFFTVVTDANASDINVRPNMNAGTPVYAGIVTIWYTKDSDVAGSGSYGSLGVPMEHYDNTEKVVGTWFGETLYEKTVTFTAPSGNGNHTIMDLSGWNMSKLIDIESNGSYQDYLYTFPTRTAFLAVERGVLKMNVADDDWGGYEINATIKYTKSTI